MAPIRSGSCWRQRRILDQAPLIIPIGKLGTEEQREQFDGALHKLVRDYRNTLEHPRRVLAEEYKVVDLARKVPVGSPTVASVS